MALGFPDEIQHNNPALAVVDAAGMRGGGRTVASRAELYALGSLVDQLKEHVTRVRIRADELNGNTPTDVLLVDIARLHLAEGWQLLNVSSGGAPVVKLFVFTQETSFTYLHNLGRLVATQILNAAGLEIGGSVQQAAPFNSVVVSFSEPVTGSLLVI